MLPQCRRLITAEGIQNMQMRALLQQALVLMLTVNIDQQLCHGTELCQCHRLIVDLDLRTFLRNLPAYDQLPVLRLDIQLPKLVFLLFGKLRKDQLHKAVFPAVPDQILAGLGAQCQVDGADQNGFSRTGLTGQNIQSLAEFHL